MALTEEEKRRKALEIQAQLLKSNTQNGGGGAEHVTMAPEAFETAAESARGRREAPCADKKIASFSAAARATQAAGGGQCPHPNGRQGTARENRTEMQKTKPNRRENEFMLNLMVLRNTLRTNAPSCRERARRAGKWIWRDIRLMTTLVDRIQDAMLETMPASRDEYYSAYAKHGHYELRIDGPVRTARHLLVTDMHLAAICEAAMKSECILCMRDGSEIDRCQLREALLEAAPPTSIGDGDSLFRQCEYRDAAGQLVQGKDVTV